MFVALEMCSPSVLLEFEANDKLQRFGGNGALISAPVEELMRQTTPLNAAVLEIIKPIYEDSTASDLFHRRFRS